MRTARIVLIALLMSGVLQSAMAQDTTSITSPCQPCKIALRSWSQIPVENALVTIGNCTFKVFYKKRTCNSDACQELKMEKIEQFNPTPCNEIPAEEVPAIVLGKMIESNAMGFYPDSIQPGSNGCWRFTRPSCWRVQNVDTLDCPFTNPGYQDTIDQYHVRLQIGELAPCDTSSCCTSVIYPTRNNCGEVVYDVPDAHDYPWIHFLRDEPADSSGQAEYRESSQGFTGQFSDTTCASCSQQIEGYPPPAPCSRSCHEDIMAEYRRLINARLERLYSE